MKKYLLLLAFLVLLPTIKAQIIDSATVAQMQEETMSLPRYKMFKTENNFILLKLDTRTGKVWMTQFRSSTTNNLELPVDYLSLEYSWNSWNGRFDMYATNNIYKFIVLDTYTGKTYLLQWNTESDRRFIEPIVD